MPPSLSFLDILVIVVYLAALLLTGVILERFVKNPKDMFAAGGKSPWWLSGASAYMTMFSSGTFVVWGGIAYLGGFVAVSICMTYGISALLVAYLIAGKWKETGASSASEYIGKRYGKGAVHTYTWLGIIIRVLGSAVALYSTAVIVCALIPVPESVETGFRAWLRDDQTGRFPVAFAIVVIGLVVLVISGNLWAVLVTDGLQFLVLTVSVAIVVPLLLGDDAVGGISGFLEKARETPSLHLHGGALVHTEGQHLTDLASGPFTWIFLGGWIVIHMFKIGGEWAFVQRFVCVPQKKDAVKVGVTFGVLYLLTPVFWMLPPMIHRILNPIETGMAAGEAGLLGEQAYIMACASVLPAGLLGLLVAAMLSATMSMIDSEVNVYAGAVTRDIYGPASGRMDDERHLMKVGRVMTIGIGLLVMALALLVPHLGGAQNLILTITGLFVGPLVLPTIWALFSRNANASYVYLTVLVGAAGSAILKFGLNDLPFVQDHSRTMDVLVGIFPPLLCLVILEMLHHRKNSPAG